jgi:RNA polymerase primary sigma factor
VKPLPAYRKVKAEVIAALCARARRGDLAARNELIRANMRLVARIATRCARSAGRLDILDDLIQEAVAGASGHGGLVRAIELFKPERGQAFSTFAAFWIHNEVLALINRQRVVAGSSNAAKRRQRIQRARDAARAQLGRDPTTLEVRHELIASGCTHASSLLPATIDRALSWSLAEVSFEYLQHSQENYGGNGHSTTIRDQRALFDHDAPDEDALIDGIDSADRLADLRGALAQLTPEQRRAIERRYALGRAGGKRRAADPDDERNGMAKLREILMGATTQ